MRDAWTTIESMRAGENTMYDLFTEQRLAKIRQQELIAQARQYDQRRHEQDKPSRRMRTVPVLARVLVMLGR